MAEITRRRTGELLRKLFENLMKHPDGLPASEALTRLADSVTMTEYEAGIYESSGSRRFEKIVRFATVDCVKAEWLLKQNGTWSITEAGAQAYRTITDPEAFYKEAVRLYRAWKATRPGEAAIPAAEASADEDTAEESATITFEEAEEQAWAEIERHLQTMKPFDFQYLVSDLLKAMDYYVNWVSPPGKDGGVDIIAFTDPLGTRAPRIKVQVKRLNDRVSSDGLRAFIATISDNDAGLFVCTGGFTRDAEEVARNQERRKITLINAKQLVRLWTEHYAKLSDRARRRLPLSPIYFLAPEA